MKLEVLRPILQLTETFTISRASQDEVDTVIVKLEKDGITGYGEASPSPFYGHSGDSVEASIRKAEAYLHDADPFHFQSLLAGLPEVVEGDHAALCAIDTALYDWIGKKFGQPWYRLWGLNPDNTPLSSFTIGISSIDHMREKAKKAAHFPILKVKLGTEDDLAIMKAIREETQAILRIDANCAWDIETTLEMSKELKALGVEYIEQPMLPERLEEMEEIYHKSALPVYADENSVTPEDIPKLVGKFHGINIKLVKCGGIYPAQQMVHIARVHGFKIMIGCMIESSVGISAASHLGPLVDCLDLDGSILISNDPYTGTENEFGKLKLSSEAGFGIQCR